MTSYTAQLMINEARRRGWQAEMLDETFTPIIALTAPDGSEHYFYSCVSATSSAPAYIVSTNKLATYKIAERLHTPVAQYVMYDVANPDQAEAFLASQQAQGYDVVVKPIDKDHGKGITVGIADVASLREAIAYAEKYSRRIIVQRQHQGDDCRVTVVDGVCVAAVRRTPPKVIGDGQRTLEQLIAALNADPKRSKEAQAQLRPIDLDDVRRFVGSDALTAIPTAGEEVALLGTANLSKGGETEDITDSIHSSYKEAAVRIAEAAGLGVCGADFLTPDCTQPLTSETGILMEINAAIGLRLHHMPTKGEPRNVAAAIFDAFVKYNNLEYSEAVS